MLLPIFGLDTPLLHWCGAVVSALLGQHRNDDSTIRADAAGTVLSRLMSGRGVSVLLSTRPDAIVRQALREAQLPVVLAATSSKSGVEHLISERGFGPSEAVRVVLGDLAVLAEFIDGPRTLKVTSRQAIESGAETILLIAGSFGIPCGAAEAAAIAGNAAGALQPESPSRVSYGAEQVAIDAVLDGIEGALLGEAPNRIVVTRHFFTADTGGAPLSAVDATGRNRLLFWGPFVPLPSGDWTARCVYSFSAGVVGTPMSIDVIQSVGGLRELARTSFVVTSAGRVDVDLRFLHDEPEAAIEVRLFSDRPIFDGTVSLGFVEFRRNMADVDKASGVASVGSAH